MAHLHKVYDSDTHFIIDPITREISNEGSKKVILIQKDHNAERFTFQLPKLIEGHDMTKCNLVAIHYINIDASDKELFSKGVYEADDVAVVQGDNITFSWLISENATKYVGTLSFCIRFECTTGSVVEYRWQTGINSRIAIASSLDNTEVITEAFPDILAQWKAEIFEAGGDAVVNVNVARDEAIQAVQDEGTTQVENVKAAAETIISDRERIYLNNALKASVIEGSAEGEVILLNDSADAPIIEMSVHGKSTQATTEGNQLFDCYGEELQSISKGGATIIHNGDGSFTISGSGTLTAEVGAYHYYTHAETVAMLKAGTLKFTCNVDTMPRIYVHPQRNGGNLTTLSVTGNNEFEVTQEMLDDSTFRIVVGFYGASGQTIVGGIAKPVLYQEGDGTWETFTGGIASPNPEYPQEINSVENSVVSVYGKNLLPYPYLHTTITKNGGTFTVQEDGGIAGSGTPTDYSDMWIYNGEPVAKHGIITFSLLGTYENIAGSIALYDENDNVLVSKSVYYSNKPMPIDLDDYPDAARWLVLLKRSETNVEMSGVVYPQIEIGDMTEYEQYKEPTSMNLPYTLHGIPVTSGGNYTDADGQQWICDEVDLERGVLVQRIKKVIVDGSSDLLKNDTVDANWLYFYRTENKDMNENVHAVCDKLQYAKTSATYGNIGFNNSSGSYRVIYINLSSYMIENTLDELKELLNLNPLTFLYALAEPIEIALSDDEIEAFKDLVTKYPYTTILNDSGANMKVKYGIDTKLYIDNKFDELKALLQG